MSLVSRLERRFGRFAVPNLIIVLIAGQAALYVASMLPEGINLERISLNPSKIMQGEVWRLVTFLFQPPATRPLFVLFYFLLLQLFGNTLENQWGVFRFNLYIFVGWIANVAAAFLAAALLGQQAAAGGNQHMLRLAEINAPNAFLYGSLFLAFARLYPDYIFNIFFVLPIRVRWLALLAWIGYGYYLIRGDWTVRLLVLATVLNYLLFFGREHWQEFRHGQRRRSFQTKAKRALAPAKHTCVACGLNSDESPRTLFRYCSKCAGQRCYCPEHIRNHEHIGEGEPVGR
jgi:hypothetical protein